MSGCSGPSPREVGPAHPAPVRPPLLAPHLAALLVLLLVAAGCGVGEGAWSDPDAGSGGDAPDTSLGPRGDTPVLPGLDVLLLDSLHLVEGRRVGLVTNHTGVDGSGVPGIDRLADRDDLELVALFSPEHGIRGTAEAGELVDHEMDEATGLPIHSLYGETRKPTPEMLQDLEVLLFDIQDIGTRYYTYIYTMALAMEAAGEAGLPFVVLDRPNPIGGRLVQGNLLDPEHASFVGLYPIPMRHGLTPGELARLFQAEFGVRADLHVVPVRGWNRDLLFDETGLPWIPPSPNMPSLESALHYPGTCLFEGTNLSVGRGTDRAFQQVGAPWIDPGILARRMMARGLEGVRFEPVHFTPVSPGDGKFDGVEAGGVRIHVTDAGSYDPTLTGVALLVETRRLSGEDWSWRESHFDRLAGTSALRTGIEAGFEPEALVEGWAAGLRTFEAQVEDLRLYP